jgi:serine/threonine-protein kinase
MAEVYLAHDDVLDRDVALKVMSGRYADDDEFVERFRREAQSAAALSHPNIVSIYDRGEDENGTYYIAMEYLPGGTLKDRILKRGALPPKTAAAVSVADRRSPLGRPPGGRRAPGHKAAQRPHTARAT